METIKNYLETMFLNLPNTPEVYRAKSELLQMMEDKYTELKEEGKSENEAIGIVISEFGNLDELAADLGIANFVQSNSQMPAGRALSLEEVKGYLADHAKHAYMTSLGVMFCILSFCGPIFLSAAAEISPRYEDLLDAFAGAAFFLIVAIGVGLLVYSGVSVGKWKYLKTERCVTDFATTEYIHQRMESYKGTYAVLLTVGIILCILCVLPPIIFDAVWSSSAFWEDCSGAFLFVFVAVGVFLIVMGSMRLDSYKQLLHLNGQGTVGGSYVPNQQNEPQYINKTAAAVMSVYWPTVTCLYLIWSFLSFDWYITWIIWPIAGIVHTLVKNMLAK